MCINRCRIVVNPKFDKYSSLVSMIPDIFTVKGDTIYSKRNVVKRFAAEDGSNIIVKKYKVPNLIQQLSYSSFRMSKAERAYIYAIQFLQKGIETPEPIAFIETYEKGRFTDSYFVSMEDKRSSCDVLLSPQCSAREQLIDNLAHFIVSLHKKGVMHGDLNLSNILYEVDNNGTYTFSVIDINRSRFTNNPSIRQCLNNLMRMTHRRDVSAELVAAYADVRRWDKTMCVEYVRKEIEAFEHRNDLKHSFKKKHKRIMGKKTVLLDLRDINHVTCGLGQIAKNYAGLYSGYQSDDIKFVFLLPKNFKGTFSDNVEPVNVRPKLNKHCPWTLPKVDLWHSIHQRQTTRRITRGTKYVFTIHNLNFMTEKNRLRQLKHLFILQRRINQADAVVACSHYVAEQVKRHLDLKGKDIQVIYNGVERIDGGEERKPPFVSDRPFFFTIGQIRRKKNFHVLLDVMKSFPEYDLFICGDNHFDYAEEIKAMIERMCLKNVFLTGPIEQEEKVWMYKHCEAFLFPSMCEGSGLPVIEAMQFGRAVYVSAYTCLPEIGGGHAFVWKELTTQCMVDTIKKTLPEFYSNKGKIEEEREYAFSFSYGKHIDAYCRLYRKLLNEK